MGAGAQSASDPAGTTSSAQAGGTSGVLPAPGDGTAGAGVAGSPPRLAVTTPFFAEQLTAFEVWLDFGANQVGCQA